MDYNSALMYKSNGISVPNKIKLCNLHAISGSSSNIAIHTNGNLTFV